MSEVESRPDRQDLVDALASAVLHADDRELAADAAAAGEDLEEAAERLREHFLARVNRARAAEVGASHDTLADPLTEELEPTPASAEDDKASEQANPMRIGRYPILRRLGAGGMGVVYAAYDEILDRRLAIKVLHDHVWDVDGRRRERLLREAQAMARVSHPNLVTVHEVGSAGDRIFVVMEFVAGPTLRQWLALGDRSWREIVRVFAQIAEGLAALHEAGLVHRDVKPANVIIGDDGRVRVLDLGLANTGRRELVETNPDRLDSSSSLNRIEGPLTMTGELLGTPAYMSREQFLGLELTPASDIFSLSVALYEALHGVHPFLATTFHELQTKVIDGEITPPSSSSAAPAWLAGLALRGLAPDPKDRPESMRAFAAALTRDPARTRRRFFATFGLALLAALGGIAVAGGPAEDPPPPSCDGGEEVIAEVWNDAHATDIREALIATDRPYAAPLADRTTAGLDDYAAAWAAAHRRICEEHARGEHSAALLDARMACLDRRRQALVETVALLRSADGELLDHAGRMVAKLPRLEPCDELGALSSPLVEDGADAQASAALETKLVRVEALTNAGRVAEAIDLARAVAAEAGDIDDQPTVGRALLAEARASILLSPDHASAAPLFDRALAIAIAEGQDPLAAEAMIRRVYVRGLAPGGSDAALADLPVAEAMLSRVGGHLELRALLENNAGAVLLAAGERDRARAAFEQALALKESLFGHDHLEIAVGLANLAILTPDEQTRRDLHQRMIDIYEHQLGPEHPRTLDALFLTALQTADPQSAGAALRDLCPRFVAIDEPRLAGECELARGRLEFARGRGELGRAAMSAARSYLDGDRHRELIDGYLAIGTGAAPQSAVALRERIAAKSGAGSEGDWWILLELAELRVVLARLLGVSTNVELLEQAIVDLEEIAPSAPPIERERLLAGARANLALALAEAGQDKRATSLAAEAARFYRRWPAAYAARLDQLQPLVAHLDP